MRKLAAMAIVAALLALNGCTGGAMAPVGTASPRPTYTIEGQDVTALYKAARAEGHLIWYGSAYADDQVRQYYDEFAKEFPGIRVDMYRADTATVLQRFLEEATAGKPSADILLQADAYSLADLGKKALLLEYAPAGEALYPHPEIFGQWVQPHAVAMVGPVYNPAMVSPADEQRLRSDWSFLTDPKWADKLAVSLPESGGTSYAPNYMFLGELQDKFGPAFISGLKPNIGKTAQSTLEPAEWVAAGQFAIQPWGYTVAAGDLLRKGAKIRQAFPPPTPLVYMGMAIAKNAPHVSAAKLFMEWAFSRQGQEAMVRICSAASARSDLKLDPYTQYDWYVPPTQTFTPKDLNQYLAGQKTIPSQWHELTGTK